MSVLSLFGSWFGKKTYPPKGGSRAVPARQHVNGAAGKATGIAVQKLDAEPNLQKVYSVADLPFYRKIHTVQGGQYELPPSQRENCVAIATDSGSIWILAEPNFFKVTRVFVNGLRERMRKDGLTIEKTVLAEKELIAAVYEQATRLHEAEQFEEPVTDEGILFDELVRYGLKNRASDIHVEIRGQSGEVRYRIDGELEPMRNNKRGIYTMEQLRDAIGYAYNFLQSDRTGSNGTFNPEINQSCMIPYKVGSTIVNLRYQSLRAWEGFDVIMRIQRQEETIKVERFQDLGYTDDQAQLLDIATRSRKGMVIICGIPGSGKSTTQKTIIQNIPGRETQKIITVEDPVEFKIEGTTQTSHQRSLDSNAEKTPFRETQAVLMRCNPNIVMQGEIRDKDTGESAQIFLETGLQVMATVHAQSVFGVFPRLLAENIGFSVQTLTTPQFLALVIYQALVPLLCEHCRVPAHKVIPEKMDFIHQRFDMSTDGMYVKNPDGCEHCNHRGTTGQTVVAEMLAPDRAILRKIREGDEFGAEELWRSRSDKRFDTPNMEGKTVFEHALYKAYLGQIDPRVVERFETFERFEILGHKS